MLYIRKSLLGNFIYISYSIKIYLNTISYYFISFYSGDATAAFSSFGTGLALTIARTRPYVKQYGIIGFITAFIGSFLRIVAFMHWTTDVIVGSTIGFLFGFGIPWYIYLNNLFFYIYYYYNNNYYFILYIYLYLF